jgi:hypothetical protein
MGLTCENADLPSLAVADCSWSRLKILRTICGLGVSAVATSVLAADTTQGVLGPPSRTRFDPLQVTWGLYSPSASFCYPGGKGPLPTQP